MGWTVPVSAHPGGATRSAPSSSPATSGSGSRTRRTGRVGRGQGGSYLDTRLGRPRLARARRRPRARDPTTGFRIAVDPPEDA